MSLHSFMMLAHSLRKKDALDLCHAHIHSLPGSCSFAFHVVARKHALTVSPHGQRCGGVPGAAHPLPTGPCRVEGTRERTSLGMQVENQAHPCPDAFSGSSVKRHLSRIFPCLTRSLARCLSLALRQLRGSASHFVRPAGYGFQKIFSTKLRTERGRKDFPNLP